MAHTLHDSRMQEALGYHHIHVLWHVILPTNWLDLRIFATLKEVEQEAARN